MRARKTKDVWEVRGNFHVHGWETVAASEVRSEAVADLRTYRREDPCHEYRLIRTREPLTQG